MTDHLTDAALQAVEMEREAQDEKWGEQNHPYGTCSGGRDRRLAYEHRLACDAAAADGSLTWRHILLEKVYEALAEDDPARLREELIQVAAVAVNWVESIDRRTTRSTS